jgi:hypothetical protein
MRTFTKGQKVLVKWHGFKEPLSGTFDSYSAKDNGEDFERLKVTMDNGFGCDGSGFHPNHVTAK